MSVRILIVDYGTSNVRSVYKALHGLQDTTVIIGNRPEEVRFADKLILPGIGHFAHAMDSLIQSGMVDALTEAALVQQKPFLGICLGMQLMAEMSNEGRSSSGLGWVRGAVNKLAVRDLVRFKVPHIGWGKVQLQKNSLLWQGVDPETEFYFAHSYHLEVQLPETVLSVTEYEQDFVSSIAQDNLFGVQFHPEKSYEAGSKLLKNFAAL